MSIIHNNLNFSIIIPCYNEEENINQLFNEIKNTLSRYICGYEVIYVNDFSCDKTQVLVENIIKNNSNVKLINNLKRSGQSKSIFNGAQISKYDYFFTLDGDGQNNPKDLIEIIKSFGEEGYDLIYGIRILRKDSFSKRMSSKIANSIRSFMLNDKCIDTGCGIKFFKKSSFNSIHFFNGNHRFYPALFLGKGFKIKSINVDHRARTKGYSKYGNLSRAIKGIIDIFRVFIINFKR